MHGVRAEVHHDLLELIYIAEHFWQRIGQVGHNRDVARYDALSELQALRDDGVDIDRLERARIGLAQRAGGVAGFADTFGLHGGEIVVEPVAGHPVHQMQPVERIARVSHPAAGIGADAIVLDITTKALKQTRFDITVYLDGKVLDQISDARDEGTPPTFVRRGRHTVKFVVTDAAIHERPTRTVTFLGC